jgi:molybdopterin/thiamine biosynthesis adenylyltransferase
MQRQQLDPFECQFDDGTRILVAGMGGIGSALLTPLTLFLNSLQVPLRLVLIDGDTYAPSDNSRQAFDGLGNKATVKVREVSRLLGVSDVTVAAVPQYLQPENLGQTIRNGDWLLLCVDNHETRKLVSDHCRTLDEIVLISGGNEGFDPPRERGTYGSIQVVIRRSGKDTTVALDHYHPEIARADGELPHEAGCGQLVASVPQLVFTNFAVASAMANAFFAVACNQIHYQEVKLDILEARMLPQFPMAGQPRSNRLIHPT